MKIEIVIDTVIKMFIINLFVFILFFKISNQKCNYLKIFVGSVMLSVIYVIEKNYICVNYIYIFNAKCVFMDYIK